jgi:hypothetical protein
VLRYVECGEGKTVEDPRLRVLLGEALTGYWKLINSRPVNKSRYLGTHPSMDGCLICMQPNATLMRLLAVGEKRLCRVHRMPCRPALRKPPLSDPGFRSKPPDGAWLTRSWRRRNQWAHSTSIPVNCVFWHGQSQRPVRPGVFSWAQRFSSPPRSLAPRPHCSFLLSLNPPTSTSRVSLPFAHLLVPHRCLRRHGAMSFLLVEPAIHSVDH